MSRRLARVCIGHWTAEKKLQNFERKPTSLIKKPSDDRIATIDKIIFVTAVLTNLSQTVSLFISLLLFIYKSNYILHNNSTQEKNID